MSSQMVETLLGQPNVRANTIVGTNGVYYNVERVTNGEWVMTWEKFIPFGRDKMHRAGGYAFQQAAQDQEFLMHQGYPDNA